LPFLFDLIFGYTGLLSFGQALFFWLGELYGYDLHLENGLNTELASSLSIIIPIFFPGL